MTAMYEDAVRRLLREIDIYSDEDLEQIPLGSVSIKDALNGFIVTFATESSLPSRTYRGNATKVHCIIIGFDAWLRDRCL